LHIQYQTVEQSMRLSHDSIVVSAAVEPALSISALLSIISARQASAKRHRSASAWIAQETTSGIRYKKMKSGEKIWRAWKHRSVISAGKQLISIYRE
jgi:hypothetical protein